MKIKTVQVFNFMGISGKKKFDLEDSITSLCLPNGSGKTSFINAIRYGLTGDLPINPVTAGEEKMAVELVFENGVKIGRMLTHGKTKCFIGEKPCNVADVDNKVREIAGTEIKALKTITSSELLSSMSTKDMGDLVLAYIPEELTADTVVSYIPSINEDMEQIVRSCLPEGETFGITELTNLYKTCYERRRLVKKKIAEVEGFLSAYKDKEMPTESQEVLQKKYEALAKDLETATMYDEKMRAYQNALLQHDRLEKQVKEVEEQIAAIPGGQAEDPTWFDDPIKSAREQVTQATSAINVANHNIETCNKMLANLEGTKCPLSDRLVCTTDKEPLKEELNKTIKENSTLVDEQQKFKAEAEKLVSGLEKKQAEARAILAGAEKRKILVGQKESLEKELRLVKVPEKPQPIQMRSDAIRVQMQKTQQDILNCANIPKVQKYQDFRKKCLKMRDDYEALVKAFANDGVVKENIIRFYTGQLEAICNEKADNLKRGMKFRFKFSGGLQVTADVKGNGIFLPYASLSGGEKAYMVYVMMHMFSELSGIRMLFLDELSVLDSEAFDALVNLLTTHTDDYDQAIIAAAEHPDTRDSLERHGVTMMPVIDA